MAQDDTGAGPSPARELEAVRLETREELHLLHERVSALLAAETFLTIAYTATRGSTGAWVGLVAPTLSLFGLLMALLAWPGVVATARLVVAGTARTGEILQQHPHARTGWSGAPYDRRRREADQARSLLFFRAAPALLVVLWLVLLVSALVQRG